MKPRQPADLCTVPISEEGESYSGDERASGNQKTVAQSPSLFVSEGFLIFLKEGSKRFDTRQSEKGGWPCS